MLSCLPADCCCRPLIQLAQVDVDVGVVVVVVLEVDQSGLKSRGERGLWMFEGSGDSLSRRR